MLGRSRESAPWAGKPGSREPRIKAARRIGQRDAFPGGVGAAYAAGESGAADVGIAANRDAPVWQSADKLYQGNLLGEVEITR